MAGDKTIDIFGLGKDIEGMLERGADREERIRKLETQVGRLQARQNMAFGILSAAWGVVMLLLGWLLSQ